MEGLSLIPAPNMPGTGAGHSLWGLSWALWGVDQPSGCQEHLQCDNQRHPQMAQCLMEAELPRARPLALGAGRLHEQPVPMGLEYPTLPLEGLGQFPAFILVICPVN